jgi:uncharacterized protein YjbJ (UPF0337 family)
MRARASGGLVGVRRGAPLKRPSPGVDRGVIVGLDDKLKNAGEDLKGKAKEAAGRANDDPELEGEGKGDQVKSDLKQAGEKVKDAFKH